MWAVVKDLRLQRVSTHHQGFNMIVSLGYWKYIRIHPADIMGTFLLLSPYYVMRFLCFALAIHFRMGHQGLHSVCMGIIREKRGKSITNKQTDNYDHTNMLPLRLGSI